jgi:acylphosphatase
MTSRRTVFFTGHVQGVGFRFVARQIAASFDVKGYVRNLPDGRVELLVEGEGREIDALLDRIREKMQGYVDQLTQTESPPTGEFYGFEIRR